MNAMAPVAPFEFDGDYKNLAQVLPYYQAYTARYRALDAAGAYPYDDSFNGYLGIGCGKSEDTAIYLCQTLTHIHEDALRVNDFIADGGRFLADERPTGRVDVAMFGWYMGGTGFKVHRDVRLVYRGENGPAYMLLPKGKRTHGYALNGVVLFRPTA